MRWVLYFQKTPIYTIPLEIVAFNAICPRWLFEVSTDISASNAIEWYGSRGLGYMLVSGASKMVLPIKYIENTWQYVIN